AERDALEIAPIDDQHEEEREQRVVGWAERVARSRQRVPKHVETEIDEKAAEDRRRHDAHEPGPERDIGEEQESGADAGAPAGRAAARVQDRAIEREVAWQSAKRAGKEIRARIHDELAVEIEPAARPQLEARAVEQHVDGDDRGAGGDLTGAIGD